MNAHEVMLNKGIAYRKTVKELSRCLKPHELTVAEWLCLGAVEPGQREGGEIAQILGVTKGMASRQLAELESRGLVHEYTSKDDARAHFYMLSNRGRQIFDAANISAASGMKNWLAAIDTEHIHIYISVLNIVAKL